MAKWYAKYLSAYNVPFPEAPAEAVQAVREALASYVRSAGAPEVSVVAIAHNESTRILACLWSLCDNESALSREVIVVNNCSTDGTEAVLRALGVAYYNEERKGPGHARQCGLTHARGKWHLCIDADTLYPPHYIDTMVGALRQPGTVCAYALWSFLPDARHPAVSMAVYEMLRDVYLRLQDIKRPELNVRGMVFAFVTEEGRRVGFRTDILRGEDGSLALALKQRGRLRFVTSRKARAMTGYGTLAADGSLAGAFAARAKKGIGGLFSLFRSKDKYEDKEENMI